MDLKLELEKLQKFHQELMAQYNALQTKIIRVEGAIAFLNEKIHQDIIDKEDDINE